MKGKIDMFTAVQLAKEMKLPPKRVRAILRKAGVKHDGRWKFETGEKAKLKELIRASRARANLAKARKPATRRALPKPSASVEARVH
jgi:hypothetical protein